VAARCRVDRPSGKDGLAACPIDEKVAHDVEISGDEQPAAAPEHNLDQAGKSEEESEDAERRALLPRPSKL
jgi:hypothetical protein